MVYTLIDHRNVAIKCSKLCSETTHLRLVVSLEFWTFYDIISMVSKSVDHGKLWSIFKSGLLIFLGKKSKISREFQGQICGKIGQFRRKKVKIGSTIGRFRAIFEGEKSKFEKNRRIFRGKFLGKSADFTGNFGWKLRQETISKKQLISLGFFWQIWLKSINFASIWPALVNFFVAGLIIILLFQQQFAREMSEMLKQLTLWLVPSFSQRSSKNAW